MVLYRGDGEAENNVQVPCGQRTSGLQDQHPEKKHPFTPIEERDQSPDGPFLQKCRE